MGVPVDSGYPARRFKWILRLVLLLQLFAGILKSQGHSVGDKLEPLTRISFGSCANQSAPQPIWDAILSFDPHLFVWLGDNIYADVKQPTVITGKERTVGPWKNVPRFWPVSPEEMEHKYQIAKNISGYRALRKKTKVIGTWDDHDYGLNDAGKEYEGKDISQKLMLDFLDEPLNSPRRKQKGVYTSYTYGPAGKRIKVILLDTRYHRDPVFSDGTMLGDVQWRWFEYELRHSDAQINIIASSIQVVANFSAMTQPFFSIESWNNFPRERLRLYGLLQETNVSGVIFISGDVHYCEITRYDCGLSYPIYDITSSGLTQGVEELASPPFSYILPFAAWLMPETMRVRNSDCRSRSCIYGKQNFGTLEIDWDAQPVTVQARVRDVLGVPVIGTTISLPELQPGYLDAQPLQARELRKHCIIEIDLPWYRKYMLAIIFFGTLTVGAGLVVLSLLLGAVTIIRTRRPQKPKTD